MLDVIVRQKETPGGTKWYAPQRSAVAPFTVDNSGDHGALVLTDATGLPFMIPWRGSIEISLPESSSGLEVANA